MDNCPRSRFQIMLAQVRVQISGEQGGLKKDQAGSPDGRRAAEPGEDEAADQRLNLEQQKGADKDGTGIECRESRRTSRFHARSIDGINRGARRFNPPPSRRAMSLST